MDNHQMLKEVDQTTTRYEMTRGSLQGVLDHHNPDSDLQSGTQELEEERETKNCDGWLICIVPLVLGGLLLAGYAVNKIVKGLWLTLYNIE